jgi:hypothetical protein
VRFIILEEIEMKRLICCLLPFLMSCATIDYHKVDKFMNEMGKKYNIKWIDDAYCVLDKKNDKILDCVVQTEHQVLLIQLNKDEL